MQAQAQSVSGPTTHAGARTAILGWLTALHVAMHVMWLALPSFVDGDNVGTAQHVVTSTMLTFGLIALAGMWRGFAWGRWMMIVVTAMNLVFALPEVFALEGIMRAGAILATLGLAVTMALLFRPEVRNRS